MTQDNRTAIVTGASRGIGAEIAAVFKGMGKDVSVGTLANMLRLADDDGSGTLSYEEFEQIVKAAM